MPVTSEKENSEYLSTIFSSFISSTVCSPGPECSSAQRDGYVPLKGVLQQSTMCAKLSGPQEDLSPVSNKHLKYWRDTQPPLSMGHPETSP